MSDTTDVSGLGIWGGEVADHQVLRLNFPLFRATILIRVLTNDSRSTIFRRRAIIILLKFWQPVGI